MELTFGDPKVLNSVSRPFNCNVCLKHTNKTAEVRRCREDRWDFDYNDNASVFPIRIDEAGNLYGFCPARVTWDYETQSVFQMLMVSVETGALYKSGGIVDQPHWFIDLLGWFAPAYGNQKFVSRAKMILGDSKKGGSQGGHNKGRSSNHGNGGRRRRG